jgi:hypothetical protein
MITKLGGSCSSPTANIEAEQDIRAVRASLYRDFVFEALAPAEGDSAAVRLCLRNDDDVGARYHLQRLIGSVKAAATTFRELEALKAETVPPAARAA